MTAPAPGTGPQPVPASGLAGTAGSAGSTATLARSRREDVLHRLLHGTPGRMRVLAAAAVVAAIAIGAVSANALLASRAAAERAANNTAQVVRVQSIHVDLLRADALATNAFLVGGLESAEQRSRYDAAISAATTGIATAAAAQPADGRALGALADEVRSYAALVEQARANNRLGLPVGAQYLKEASAGLRSDAIPVVQAVTQANEGRAEAEFGRADSTLQLFLGIVAIMVLLGVALWLARRTHRYLNGPLTGAIVLLMAALIVAAATIGQIGQTAAAVERGDYATAAALADVSTAANDARANESLTLIARGSGSAFEKAWAADDVIVRSRLADARAPLTGQWQRYAAAHQKVRTLDNGGQWEQAVALATTSEATGSGPLFEAFDSQVALLRDDASAAAVNRLDGLGEQAPFFAVAIGLAALVASWLIVRGVGRRIEEYR
jgi:hypothetical protein